MAVRLLKLPLLICLSLLVAIASVMIGVSQADALQAMLRPSTPKLGDTVLVLI